MEKTIHVPALAGGVWDCSCPWKLGTGHHCASHYIVQKFRDERCVFGQYALVCGAFSPYCGIQFAVDFSV